MRTAGKLATLGVGLLLSACGGAAEESVAEATGGTAMAASAGAVKEPGSQATEAGNEPPTMAEIAAAAGLVPHQSIKGWWDGKSDSSPIMSGCELSEVGVEEMRDINGDGQAEAIVYTDGPCYGRTGPIYLLLARTKAEWAVINEGIDGTYLFFPRQGIAWPDIELTGIPTKSNCFEFSRWNGKKYVYGGTSKNGKICELAPEFAAAAPKATGAGGFPPIPEGFYATNATCAEAASFGDAYVYFDRKNWIEIDGGSEVTGIKNTGGSNWTLELDGGGPPLKLTITGPASFTEYGRTMTHCPTSGVPAQARKDFGPAG